MKKIFILLGCVASSYVSVTQAQNTPVMAAETFVVVPRNEINGNTLEPISLPLNTVKTNPAKSVESDFEEKEVRVESGDYRKDDAEMLELVRREHARNVAKDEAQERAKKEQEKSKFSIDGSSNSKKSTVVVSKEVVEKNKQTTVKAKQEKISSKHMVKVVEKPEVKKVSNTSAAVNKAGDKGLKPEKPIKATAKVKTDVQKVSSPGKSQAKVTKQEPVKAKTVTSKANTSTKVSEKKAAVDKSKTVKKSQEKSKK